MSRRDLAAYAAALWAFDFAVPSFAWAAGVRAGSETIAADVEEAGIANPWLLTVTGVLKVLAGVVALSLVRPWGRALPRPMLLFAAWATALIFCLYAVANFVQHGLMEAARGESQMPSAPTPSAGICFSGIPGGSLAESCSRSPSGSSLALSAREAAGASEG